jgi:hypothetical protein
MKNDLKHHTCCGQRKRYRAIDGKLIEQPHECNNAQDTKGKDWAEDNNVIALPKQGTV